MNIALDIDGVVADTTKAVKAKVAEAFGIDHKILRQSNDYNNVYKLDNQELHDEVNKYVRQLFLEDSTVYRDAEEVSGAWYGTRIIKPIAYITRRPDGFGIAESTHEWLERSGMYKAPVFFIPKGTCKSTKARELGADLIVEDSPYEIVSCRNNGFKTLVFKYPYNVSVVDGDTSVVKNWREIITWWESENASS